MIFYAFFYFFFSSRRRHTRCLSDWSSDVCSSDLVHQHDIEITVIEEIADRRAARTLRLGKPGTQTTAHIDKFLAAQVAEKQSALPVSSECAVLVDLRIHVSIRGQDIQPSIVVVIEKFRAPSEKGDRNGAQTRAP